MKVRRARSSQYEKQPLDAASTSRDAKRQQLLRPETESICCHRRIDHLCVDADFVQNRGVAEFNRWTQRVREALPQGIDLELAMDMLLNGIFVSDTYEVVTVPTAYLLSREQAHDRVEQLRSRLGTATSSVSARTYR
jgi:hypothetical protein